MKIFQQLFNPFLFNCFTDNTPFPFRARLLFSIAFNTDIYILHFAPRTATRSFVSSREGKLQHVFYTSLKFQIQKRNTILS